MSDTNEPKPLFTAEEVDEIMQANFGMSAAEFEALPFEQRVAVMLASGGAYACTPNIAPKDQDGNPVTEGGRTDPTRH